MSRRRDINEGAAMAVFVVAVLAGVVTWSLEVGVIVFFGLGMLLGLLRIIR